MTKAITSTAIMMLYEEGRFQLDDPISRYLPMFKDVRVYAGGGAEKYDTVPAKSPITFKQLLTHTSGLTYGFTGSPVSAIYQAAKFDFQTEEASLWQMMERLAKLPLLAQPGTEWNYSVSTDVLGALVETISGMGFDQFLRTRIFDPLGMKDTDFHVHRGNQARFAANYQKAEGGGMTLIDEPRDSRYMQPRKLCSGGGGLVSTAGDYLRFCKMIARRGELDGVRLLGRKTVEYHADEPSPDRRRPRLDGHAALQRIHHDRDRLRPRLRGGDRPGQGGTAVLRRRTLLGRRRQHRVLDRPGRGHHRDHDDAADAVIVLPDPPRAAHAGQSGDCRLAGCPA